MLVNGLGAPSEVRYDQENKDANSETTANACATHYVCTRQQAPEGHSIHFLLHLTAYYPSILNMGHKAGYDKDCARFCDFIHSCTVGSDLYNLSKQIRQKNWREKKVGYHPESDLNTCARMALFCGPLVSHFTLISEDRSKREQNLHTKENSRN